MKVLFYKFHWINLILCAVVTMLLLVSCIDEMYNFSDKDLEWLAPYEKGDTILFCNNNNHFDTLFVKDYDYDNSYWPFIRNEGASSFGAYGRLKLRLRHNGVEQNTDFGIAKPNNSGLELSFEFSGRSSIQVLSQNKSLCDYYKQYYCGVLKLYKGRIDGVDYNDFVFIDERNSKLYHYPDYVYNCEYFIWSKSMGLLKYKYIDTDDEKGMTYTFYKKLPKKCYFWSFLFGE